MGSTLDLSKKVVRDIFRCSASSTRNRRCLQIKVNYKGTHNQSRSLAFADVAVKDALLSVYESISAWVVNKYPGQSVHYRC